MFRLNRFLYNWVSRRSDPRPLGLTRIGIGIAFLLDWLNKIDRRESTFDPNVFHYPWADWLPVLPAQYSYLPFILWLIGGIGFTIGYKTRLSGAIALLGNGLNFFSDRQNYSNHGYLLLLLIFLLILADSGAALSLDSRKRTSHQAAVWTVDLLKIQLSIVYFFTFAIKIRPDWLSGGLMYVNSRGLLAPLFLEINGAYRIVSVLALIIEGFLFWALWSKKWRELAFFLGLMLHIGILLVVKFTLGLISFGLLSLSLYFLFLDIPADKVVVRFHQSARHRYLKLMLRSLDWLNIFSFQSCDLTQAKGNRSLSRIEIIEPNGRKRSGSQAFYRLCSLLPLTSFFAIIFRPRFSQSLLQKIAHIN